MSYLHTVENLYRDAAVEPDVGLCCTTTPIWALPGLVMPERMLEMNYGCGSTVHPRDLEGEPTVLYVGVGGGLELLQLAYFSRREGGIVGVDPVPEMREACRLNLEEAARLNPWFDPSFITLVDGTALNLPVESGSVDVAAQNCLFNIFELDDLDRALAEIYRVLRPRGRFVSSDPICEVELPEKIRSDQRLRAQCLSGAIPYSAYVDRVTATGFGTMEVRARRPYRVLDPGRYAVHRPILLESIEVAAFKDPMPVDGACVFTGRTAIYYGDDEFFDDDKGHVLLVDQPAAVCDKTGAALESLGRDDIMVTPSTWFYDGGGCC